MATAEAIDDRAKVEHAEHVAHHFESAQQQFDAGKLGMWLFLVTEVLFFSGLFVAYAVYRSNHPEVFVDAHKYLNTTLGAFNTIVLLVSSLTMAWAVRSAQLNDKRNLVRLLAATLACASLFLGVKAVEYSHKWDQGLLWAGAYATALDHSSTNDHTSNSLMVLSIPALLAVGLSPLAIGWARFQQNTKARRFWQYLLGASLAFFVGVGIGQTVEHFTNHSSEATLADVSTIHTPVDDTDGDDTSKLTGVFFSIYYAMTGVHAIHILAGMGVIAWLLWRSIGGAFGNRYFGPVDYVGLYWHLVDLVWIYLFPLLYLIR